MMICEYIFSTLAKIYGTNSQESRLSGISYETWTVIVLVLNFMVATFWLYRYKDVFFAIVLAFTFFGIFTMQKRYTCLHHPANCSKTIKVTSVSLASILVFFVGLTFLFYKKLVLYNIRV